VQVTYNQQNGFKGPSKYSETKNHYFTLFATFNDCLNHMCQTPLMEGHCPSEFSTNPLKNTGLEASSIPEDLD